MICDGLKGQPNRLSVEDSKGVIEVFRGALPALTLVVLLLSAAVSLGGTEITMRVMPAPPSPEADYTPENTYGWDVGVGYGRVWTDEPVEAALNGFVSGVTWRGTIAGKVGLTVSPLYGGMYFGEVEGYDADTFSLATGFSAGSRLLGRAESSNLILFGGGTYAWAQDREDTVYGSYRADAHFFGFTAGAKVQVAFHRFVRLIPFYMYMGGGGFYDASIDTMIGPFGEDGSLGYRDAHLLGLDFNIFGVTAKLVADLFRDDYKSFTISVDILGTVRGVKTASAKGSTGD